MQGRSEKISSFEMLRSSATAAGLNGVCVNFLEVCKTRMMTDSIRCSPQHFTAKTFFNRHF